VCAAQLLILRSTRLLKIRRTLSLLRDGIKANVDFCVICFCGGILLNFGSFQCVYVFVVFEWFLWVIFGAYAGYLKERNVRNYGGKKNKRGI
jgi:hypothetical protein